MAKRPAPSGPPRKARRGRPPLPGGRKPQVEVQRAYRARLAAAGKVVRIVDANAVPAPGFDPAKDGIYERAMVEGWRAQLHRVLSERDFLRDELALARERIDGLEAERVRLEREITAALKARLSGQG